MRRKARRPNAYVVGAGLSGLAAATLLAARGAAVTLFEAGPQAGGRCRSYFDSGFGAVIDNGNHLVLSGNRAVRAYLGRIGAKNHLAGPDQARFDFVDVESGARWRLRLNDGPLPWWLVSAARRVPGTRMADYVPYARLLWSRKDRTVGQSVPCRGPAWERLMRPLLLAALNTEPEAASAWLAGRVLRQTLARGGRACRPRIATPSLAAAFVDPALSFLEAQAAQIRMGHRLRALAFAAYGATALEFPDATVPLGPGDALVLAVPPGVARDLVPGLAAPDRFRAIVNAHYKFPAPGPLPSILGVTGGTAEWVFGFADRISVTVSGADRLVEREREDLASLLWGDVCRALGFPTDTPLPQWQIVKERRATFAATPQQQALRPTTATCWSNLFLAGDWTATGLPATIEGALRSGHAAASLALRQLSL